MRITIVGGGILGLATAYRLLESRSGWQPVVLEKEDGVGRHQSGHNSGVLHAGLYYKPGSLKARLAVSGIRQMKAFCSIHHIPHETCGKLVVAADESELPRLRELHRRGEANGLNGLRWLDAAEMREVEPHAGGVAALHVPEEGIVDYGSVCATLVQLIEGAGGQVRTGTRVTGLERRKREWIAKTKSDEFVSDFLINCAGLHCDRVSEMAGNPRTTRIVPFRGEYYTLAPERQSLVRHLIYPTPDPKFPFLGVHFTRMIGGGVECGPNAVLALAREGYRWTSINPSDLADSLGYRGLWKFLASHKRMCLDEVLRSFSKRLFCRSLQRLVPDVRPEDLRPGGAGVRAQAMTPDGALVQDFDIVPQDRALHVINAPSPGATASLAIGAEIISRLPVK